MAARPIREHVEGAPFQPTEKVIVFCAIDRDIANEGEYGSEGSDTDAARYVGSCGVVEYLEYECGCGQSFPADPMVGVHLLSGVRMEFWPEELRRIGVA